MKSKVLCIILCLFLFVLPCSALSHSTYSDLAQNNSIVQNLISLAMNYDDFMRSDFVVYCPAQYQYYIVWGELSATGDFVTSTGEVNYISYIRSGDYNTTYTYSYGSDDTFSLNSSFVCTSNIKHFGMRSLTYEEYNQNHVSKLFFILGLGILFVIMIVNLRKVN